jgi:hypothetical protein
MGQEVRREGEEEEGDQAQEKGEVMAAKKKPKLGTGARFKQVAAAAKKGGARNPNAVAAAIGRKKYGAKKMAKMAAAGRKRKKK